ncbi:uncharacterized protein LOC130653815 [Hydractinia symbiolongicarpus]|uniref:uncharacterized protein LOC130653815 n=1 Tax=Hydractinia symbiolongicarpus TaxID=13093 RepID=UPI00254D5A6E|nr:uncharacterized protein LOC130653815 [Hydractinia symbiolongicarpus]
MYKLKVLLVIFSFCVVLRRTLSDNCKYGHWSRWSKCNNCAVGQIHRTKRALQENCYSKDDRRTCGKPNGGCYGACDLLTGKCGCSAASEEKAVAAWPGDYKFTSRKSSQYNCVQVATTRFYRKYYFCVKKGVPDPVHSTGMFNKQRSLWDRQ